MVCSFVIGITPELMNAFFVKDFYVGRVKSMKGVIKLWEKCSHTFTEFSLLLPLCSVLL